jgi:hypothetical protein
MEALDREGVQTLCQAIQSSHFLNEVKIDLNLSDRSLADLIRASAQAGMLKTLNVSQVVHISNMTLHALACLLEESRSLKHLELHVSSSLASVKEVEEFWILLGRALTGSTSTVHSLALKVDGAIDDLFLGFTKHLKDASSLRDLRVTSDLKISGTLAKQINDHVFSNFSLHSITTNFTDNRAKMTAACKLNRCGRPYLKERPHDRQAAVRVLDAVKNDLDCLYLHLRENTEFVSTRCAAGTNDDDNASNSS